MLDPSGVSGPWKSPSRRHARCTIPPSEHRVGVCMWGWSANAKRAAGFARLGIVLTKPQISFGGAEQRTQAHWQEPKVLIGRGGSEKNGDPYLSNLSPQDYISTTCNIKRFLGIYIPGIS